MHTPQSFTSGGALALHLDRSAPKFNPADCFGDTLAEIIELQYWENVRREIEMDAVLEFLRPKFLNWESLEMRPYRSCLTVLRILSSGHLFFYDGFTFNITIKVMWNRAMDKVLIEIVGIQIPGFQKTGTMAWCGERYMYRVVFDGHSHTFEEEKQDGR